MAPELSDRECGHQRFEARCATDRCNGPRDGPSDSPTTKNLLAEISAADGRLIEVLSEWTPPFPGLSLYFSGRRNIPAKLRALIDLIRERPS